MILTVSPDGSAQYTTIQAAVDAAPDSFSTPAVIRVYRGDYDEKLHITKNNLRIVGDAAERVTLTHSDYAKQTYADGVTEKGTFCSYTVIITGHNVEIENMTIRNDAGDGRVVGQAVAVYAAGDRGIFRNCRFVANQDTLYCGPVMPKVADNALPYVLPVTAASCGDATLVPYRQYFENCEIVGDVDYIFGSFTCWFEKCKLICNNRGESLNGYYTATNTPETQPFGFVFNQCHLTGDNCAPKSVSLGRPWRKFARTTFLNCQMDECVMDEGWLDWDEERPVTFRYQEYGTTGARNHLSLRHPAAAILNFTQAAAITVKTVLSGYDGWDPQHPFKTIYICGDSTAANYSPEQAPMTGWGQVLHAFVPFNVFVDNHAMCGRSSKSFIGEQRLLNIEHCLREGDILLIQFGHNDEKPDRERATDPYTTYLDYLSIYLNAAREHGAIPVLMTPITRRKFQDGKLQYTHLEYPLAMKTLAKEKGVYLVDMEQLTHDLAQTLGDEDSIPLWCHLEEGHPNYPEGLKDDTHLKFEGAYQFAFLAADALKELKLV